jgi:hypothetical protein
MRNEVQKSFSHDDFPLIDDDDEEVQPVPCQLLQQQKSTDDGSQVATNTTTKTCLDRLIEHSKCHNLHLLNALQHYRTTNTQYRTVDNYLLVCTNRRRCIRPI